MTRGVTAVLKGLKRGGTDFSNFPPERESNCGSNFRELRRIASGLHRGYCLTQRDSVRVLHAFTLCGKEHEERRSVCVPWVMHACISCDADENGNVGKSDA